MAQRQKVRLRNQRNQGIKWFLQDLTGVLCLFVILYGMMFVPILLT